MQPGPIIYRSATSVHDEIHAKCLRYWEARRNDRRWPAPDSVVTDDLTRHLPWLHMYDIWENGGFRVRLMGSAIVKLAGEDLTGLAGGPDDKDAKVKRAAEVLAKVVAMGEPVVTHVEGSVLPGARFQQLDTLWLPLSDDGETIDVVLAATAAQEIFDFVDAS